MPHLVRAMIFSTFFFATTVSAWCNYGETNNPEKPERCKCGASSPAEALKSEEGSTGPTTILNEERDIDGKVVTVSIKKEVHVFGIDGASITHYFRSKKACDENRISSIKERKESRKSARAAKENALAPYR